MTRTLPAFASGRASASMRGFERRRIEVPGGALTLFFGDVVGSAAELEADAKLLSVDEMKRAERFVRAEDRNAFVSFRSALRRVLSLETGVVPEELELKCDRLGRPSLGHVVADGGRLDFNVSHTGCFLAIVISVTHEVGVDVEKLCHATRTVEIAPAFLTKNEEAMLHGGSSLDYLRVWTRKEALLKAVGTGLLVDPRQVSVQLEGTRAHVDSAHLTRLGVSASRGDGWSLTMPEMPDAVVCAIAYRLPKEQCQPPACDRSPLSKRA